MKIKFYNFIFFILLSNCLLAQKVDNKFPLKKIGIKINKPQNYYLLTPENVMELKAKLYSLINVCSESKIALDNAMKNPNFQVLINENSYNEVTTFIRIPKFPVDKELPELLQKTLKEHCYSIKNSKIENLSMSNGSSEIGNYVSFLNKITTPELTFYSDAYFFETRNSTITVTINSIEKISNTNFIKNFEYMNDEVYEKLLDNFNELSWKNDFSNAKAKLAEAINKEPKNPVAYEKRGALNLKLTYYKEAIDDANEILKIDLTNINGHLIKGLAFYGQKNFKEAIKSFEDAKLYYSILTLINARNEYLTSFSEIYRLIGEAYLNLNNSTNATENLELALELTYDSLNTASIYFNLGVVKSTLLKNSKDAIKYYSLAIQNYPMTAKKEKSEAYYNRGLNKRYLDDLNGAISDYTLAIKIRPDYVKALNNRGYAKQLLVDYNGAISDYTMTIKYDNYTTEISNIALGNRGVAKLSLGQDGCPDIIRAIELGNKNVQKVYNQYCK
jgi:tetratricopeptide (TPR) repeat protein